MNFLRIALFGAVFLFSGSVTSYGQSDPPGRATAAVRVGGDVRLPRKLKNVPPEYPGEALSKGLEGVVTLEITIEPSGLVERVTVLRSVLGLDEAAIAAVRQWEFEPTTAKGEPVAVIATVDVSFAIARRLINRPNEADTARAAELFQEVREMIDRLAPSRTAYGIDSTLHNAAGLFLELAKAEAPAFSNLAVDDATRAFRIAQSIAGNRSDVEDRQSNDRDAVSLVLQWKNKTRIEADAIVVLISVNANDRALELTRTGDVPRAALYDPLMLVEPADRLLALAAECHASDGTYPYRGMSERARMIRGPVAEVLVRDGIAALEAESSFDGRSDGLEFIQNSYELVPQSVAVRALLTLVQRVLAQPTTVPGRGGLDHAALGPKILSVMQAIDPAQALALAKEHPEWRAAASTISRKSPPRMSDTGRRLSLLKPPPMMRLPRMSVTEFERTLSETRKMPLSTQKLQKLMALGYLLVLEPPR